MNKLNIPGAVNLRGYYYDGQSISFLLCLIIFVSGVSNTKVCYFTL